MKQKQKIQYVSMLVILQVILLAVLYGRRILIYPVSMLVILQVILLDFKR
ncbi:hypothetical protein HNP92_001002 [Methanococcus maripaludis]|uniref:Uncharacterized protein n=1 Tax=Methanococcus maripaludis TaxID=39152 RepID=A0A7J9S4G1_METMI|nr:hypothetical protein [Methanococcus maripaludis]